MEDQGQSDKPELTEKEPITPDISQSSIEPEKPIPSSNKLWKIGFFLLLAIFLVGAGGFGYYFYSQRLKKKAEGMPPSSVTTSPSPAPEVVLPQGIATGKVFYGKDNNIFSYDIETKRIEKWTDYPKNKDYSPAYDESGQQIPNISIDDIRVIDENTLGFGKCGTITGDFGCGLFVLDLRTKNITEKVKLEKESLLLDSGWFNEKRFAFLFDTKREGGRWQLHLVNHPERLIPVNLSVGAYGRGGFIEDSAKIEFSPEGGYFLHISTGSPRAGEDFNTFIYESINGEEMAVIPNSTMPSWIDEQRIVFRKYVRGDSPENGLYIYSLSSRTETKIGDAPVDSYHPEVSLAEDKIVYWTNSDKKLRFQDLKSKETKTLLEKAIHGFWVTPTEIIFEKIEPCVGDEPCGVGEMADYDVKSVDLYNLETGQENPVSELKNLYSVTSLYR